MSDGLKPKARVCKGCGRTQAPRLGGITYFSVPKELAGFWHIRCFQRARMAESFSIHLGFAVPGDISRAQLASLGAVEVTHEEWNHSSCGSSCVKRGGERCSW